MQCCELNSRMPRIELCIIPRMTMVGNRSLLAGRHNVSLLHCGRLAIIGEDPYDRQTCVCVCDTDTSHVIPNVETLKSYVWESDRNQTPRIPKSLC